MPGKIFVRQASTGDASLIEALSRNQVGDDRQSSFLHRSIDRGETLVAVESGEISGFAVWNREFYECAFVWLLQVSPEKRRQGIALTLLQQVEIEVGSGRKLFTSTNESNKTAQETFKALGFVRSGTIENLDIGDPEIVYFKQL